MDRKTISREDGAWLAAIIEGEGSLQFLNHRVADGHTRFVRPAIAITNTDLHMIRAISKIWYQLEIKFYYSLRKYKEKTKDRFAVAITTIGDLNVKKVLLAIRPFLRSKLSQADLLMEYIFWRQEKRKSMLSEQCPNNPTYKYKGFKAVSKEMKAKYLEQQQEFKDRMASLRRNTIDPQRLQRKASQPLEFPGMMV